MSVKRACSELAICGGMPAFAEALHVGKPNVPDPQRVLDRIRDSLDRRWLTNNGPLVREFEKRVAETVGVRHCIAMCNATVALEIVTRALGMKGEVIVPSMTFVATAHALQWQEITPVFCDIDPRTHHIDPSRVESLVTPRTTGIIGVHLWGRPANVLDLTEVARKRGLKLVFDAAHAFGCSYHGRMVGGFGDAEVLSFHATKFLNTFEGGAVVTNDDRLAESVRLMRNFGFSGMDNVIYIGTNGKMHEASAAMGIASLDCMDRFVAHNRGNYEAYERALSGIPGVSLMSYDRAERCNFQYIVLEIDQTKAGISRDDLMWMLHAENVIARRYFYPGVHRMEPYRSYFPNAGVLLPHTECVVEKVLVLPTGTAVSTEDVEAISGALRVAVANAIEVRRHLAARSAR